MKATHFLWARASAGGIAHNVPQGRGSSRKSILLALLLPSLAFAAETPVATVRAGADGRLVYTADAVGNRVIDFSAAGYASGGEAIPFVPAVITVTPDGRHDRERIQAALDLVAAMPRGANGFRGAVLLAPGRWAIDTSLRLNASGVVLRGSGDGEQGTVLAATGTSRRTLIEVGGSGERTEVAGSRRAVADAYVPVGATSLTVENTTGLAVGDRLGVQRPCSAEWVTLLGMDRFPGWRADTRLHWKPGSRDILWDRTITAIEGNRLTLDAPLTTALDRAYGGGSVWRYEFPGRIDHVGVENLRCVSEHPGDREEHAWCCLSLDKVENAWVRQVTARHFVSYVVNVHPDALRVTIEDCAAQDPVSELAGLRRRVFSIGGQLTLVQRCRSDHGLHDFTTGFAAAGPNVFLQCTARDTLGYSGPVESWASGVLFDRVIIRGNALRLINRGVDEGGSGWAAANSLLWNCEATDIQVQSPPGAFNRAYGCRGDVTDDWIAADAGDSALRDTGRGGPLKPGSLYLAQLAERKGGDAGAHSAAETISLAVDGARALTAAEADAFVAAEVARKESRPSHPLRVEHAQFVIDGQPAWTAVTNYSWFQGQMPRPLARAYGPAITRFAPGETGLGLTDNLEEVAAAMPPRSAFYQHYGLWYERRRVNHNFYGAAEHKDGDVWGPFMEMPWARSGDPDRKDWNSLSKYDLTRFNPWYFSRVKEFADLCDERGLILYDHFYFQHALQETRAHYVDFPWRPANCLQDTGLPDENPAASTFYDVSNPVRRDLHRLYIRHTLDVLGPNTNVVFGIDREYSGPLSFVQFWLDTIAAWEQENHRKVMICLEVPKAEMDAILADPLRGPMITAIDFHFWFYRPDGSLFTITGGLNKAPREQSVGIVTEADLQGLRDANTNPTWAGSNIVSSPEFQKLTSRIRAGTPASRYRALREYRDSYPDLVIIRKPDDFPVLTAAIEQAIPAADRARTRPADLVRSHPESAWCMAAPGNAYLVYSMAGETVELDLSHDTGSFTLAWLDSASGNLLPAGALLAAGSTVTLAPPTSDPKRPWVAWLTRTTAAK